MSFLIIIIYRHLLNVSKNKLKRRVKMEREEKKEKRKLNDKGFSFVELIIVIGIIVILAGVLSPRLIKYLDKSKKAADIQTAQTIATAVNVALADETAYNVAVQTKVSDCFKADTDTNAFQKEIKSILGSTAPLPKYKPDTYTDFYIYIAADKTFEIYAGTEKPSEDAKQKALILYPTVGTQYK